LVAEKWVVHSYHYCVILAKFNKATL
jgi:hypothetical protein